VTHPSPAAPRAGCSPPSWPTPTCTRSWTRGSSDGQAPPERAGVLIRYADDAVLVFEREGDARRVLDVLPKRFGKYGLTLHPEKTRLVPFQGPRPGAPPGLRDGASRHVRLLGVHPLLGSDAQGELGGEAQDGEDRFRRS
jgi:hypothetical protein